MRTPTVRTVDDDDGAMMMMMTRERLERKLSHHHHHHHHHRVVRTERKMGRRRRRRRAFRRGGGGGNIELERSFAWKKKHRREKRQQTTRVDGFRHDSSVRGCREKCLLSYPIRSAHAEPNDSDIEDVGGNVIDILVRRSNHRFYGIPRVVR